MEYVERLWDQFSLPLLPEGLVNFLPNLAVTFALGIAIGAWFAPRLGLTHRLTGALWLACLLAPLAYTLSAARQEGVAGCAVGLAPWESREALLSRETRTNVAMLMPAGAAALLFTSGPRRLAALGAALALSPAIELTQMVVRPLGRACQGADVLNNTIGVLLGFWVAAGVWVLWVSLAGSGRGGPKPVTGSGHGRVAFTDSRSAELHGPTSWQPGASQLPPPMDPTSRPFNPTRSDGSR